MPSKIPSPIEIPKPLVSDKFVWTPSDSEGTVTPILRSPFEQILRSSLEQVLRSPPFETTAQFPAQFPSPIEIPKPLVSDKFVWSPSESEGTVTPVLRSPFEQVLRSPFETTMKLPAQIPSPSSSISTIIYPTESKLEQFNRIKRSLVGLVVSENVDILEIIGIDENGVETEYILNSYDISISNELENMENLVMLIYHLSRDVERSFPESKVIKILPSNLRILELQNNMMIDLTIPMDIIKVEKLKFVNFYVFEGMSQRIAIPQKTRLEYINLIKQSETDVEEYGYYLLR